jgi:hypothetical protein
MIEPAAETPTPQPEAAKSSNSDSTDLGKGIDDPAGEIEKSKEAKETNGKPSKEPRDSSSGSSPNSTTAEAVPGGAN